MWLNFDNECYKKSRTDALLQETTLQKHIEVTQILQIVLKKLYELRHN